MAVVLAASASPAPASADNAIAEGYLHIQQQLPDSWPTYITLSEEQGAPSLKVRVRLNGEWHLNGRSTVWLNTHNGELRRTERSDQMAVERRLINQLYPLHSGFGMNAIYRLLTLFCGIVLTWLAVTGGLHYYKRWKHRQRRN